MLALRVPSGRICNVRSASTSDIAHFANLSPCFASVQIFCNNGWPVCVWVRDCRFDPGLRSVFSLRQGRERERHWCLFRRVGSQAVALYGVGVCVRYEFVSTRVKRQTHQQLSDAQDNVQVAVSALPKKDVVRTARSWAAYYWDWPVLVDSVGLLNVRRSATVALMASARQDTPLLWRSSYYRLTKS